jgi:uncharacterized membrane protein (DUF373 family)
VQVRTVILLAMLAIVRKLVIIDLHGTEALQIFALAAAIFSLGAVYWLVRDQDRRDRAGRDADERCRTLSHQPRGQEVAKAR